MNDTMSSSDVSITPIVVNRNPTAPSPSEDRAAAADQAITALDNARLIERVEQTLDSTELAVDLVQRREDELQRYQSLELSVVMPVYNEERTVAEIVERVLSLPLNLKLIIVDDGSDDETTPILASLQRKNPERIQVFHHETNQGKGAALRTGFANCEGDLVLVQDADLEYDPRDYPALLDPILDDRADVVYGSRFLGSEIRDPSRIHRWGNGLLTAAANLMNRQSLTDMETCYKLFRRTVLQDVEIAQDRFGFEPEITAKLARRHCRFCEVPIRYAGRGYGDGKKIGVRDAVNALYCIVRYGITD